MSDDERHSISVSVNPKKRKIIGRMREVSKKLKVSTHEPGTPCKCKRFMCFEKVSQTERHTILSNFNGMANYNEQNAYLCSLITVSNIKRRRPRQNEDYAFLHDKAYRYHVKVVRAGVAEEIPICFKAFLAIHGITKRKLELLQKSLKSTGLAPKDKRGKHSNRPHKIPNLTYEKVISHISSFKGYKSHYTLNRSQRLYLDENLNISKMHQLYKESYPEHPVSYESYRCIFNSKFNISFGYPRKDTCSICDEYQAKRKELQLKLKINSSEEILTSLRGLESENTVHKKKAEVFYERKRTLRYKCQRDKESEAICMDFQKNLPVPNITSNDVYYKRQLSVFSFNIHILATNESVFYVYPETVARKGSDEVLSMLHHFIMNYLDQEIKHVHIFCDSCGGQNKNYNLIFYPYLKKNIKIYKNLNAFAHLQHKITIPNCLFLTNTMTLINF
ncbi:hypothetical protein NQ315_016843 [Exocentrus adspersus]|uniref:Transposase n=1 Tax=Exocentrus adspersus TaxID=1586481 RepID=A0AAV8VZA1_9CUCU|nr:hypothetical protein NQ315_016843 [Exocentrus adspersus]